MWSESIKQELLRHHPGMLLVDAFSSSEALGMGMSISGRAARPRPPSSPWGPTSRCSPRTAAAKWRPGSDEIGVLALGGRNPLGYYKDEEKSDRTFKTIDGVRYSIPGDFAQVRSRRVHPPARARLGLHQLGRREDLPRGGRGGRSRRTTPCATPSWSASRTRSSARRSWRVVELDPERPGPDRSRAHRPRQGAAGRLQGPPPRALRRHHRTGPERQGRLQAPPRRVDRGARRRIRH